MPISYDIDTEQRLVIATCTGVLSGEDMFAYQQDVWSRPEVSGFDEIVEVSGVEKIAYRSSKHVMQLAAVSAEMDSKTKPSRLAIVAPDQTAFGLGRMYQTYREMAPFSNKEVKVFHSIADARAWLAT